MLPGLTLLTSMNTMCDYTASCCIVYLDLVSLQVHSILTSYFVAAGFPSVTKHLLSLSSIIFEVGPNVDTCLLKHAPLWPSCTSIIAVSCFPSSFSSRVQVPPSFSTTGGVLLLCKVIQKNPAIH